MYLNYGWIDFRQTSKTGNEYTCTYCILQTNIESIKDLKIKGQ